MTMLARAVLLLITGTTMVTGQEVTGQEPSACQVRVTGSGVEQGETEVRMETRDGRLAIDLVNPPTIGRMWITPGTAGWPTAVVLRLRLAGLEHFACVAAEQTWEANVLSHGEYARSQWRVKSGTRESLDPQDPLWIGIVARGNDGKTLEGLPKPSAGEYFEITLPPALLGGEPGPIELRWIDFYRR